jgi:hypothetical protein
MSFLNSIISIFYGDKTEELPSFNQAKECLHNWCRDLDLPLDLNEDERTHALALIIFDQAHPIVTIQDAVGKHVYKKRRDFEEFILDLDCIDSKGKGVKWVFSDCYGQNPFSRKKEFFLMLENPHHPNQFYEKAHYLWEEENGLEEDLDQK